jgi:hypothetical protein
MGLRSLADNNWVYRIVLLTWVIFGVVMIFLLNNIDSIVHGDLYNYGLQMSTDWASPYWTYLRLNYVLLAIPMALSLVAIGIGFVGENKRVVASVAKPQPKPQRFFSRQSKQKEDKRSKNKTVPRENGTMIVSCPNCKKVFSRPLVMLNFEGGNTRLVNVCPYCNHVLGSAENEQTSNSGLSSYSLG